MTSERAEPLNGNIHTADAEDPRFTFEEGVVHLRFVDWREQEVRVRFDDVCGVRWQDAGSPGPEPRNDEAYELFDSKWMQQHRAEGAVTAEHRHLRLCFNACGVFDVICAGFEVQRD